MKAMILAAGRGERLRPLTDHTPKPLLKAGELRLIEYLITSLVDAGFNELVINYAHLGEQFPATLGDGSRYGATIQYSPEPEGGLETAGGIVNALPHLTSDQFVVVNGDIWTDYDFSALRHHALTDDQLCHLIMVDNPPHNPSGDFALVNNKLELDGDNKLTFSGIGLYQRRMFTDIGKGKLALKPLFIEAITQQQATAQRHQGGWSDIGTPERLQQLEQQLREA